MELKDYIQVLRQHWVMVLVASVAVGALAYGWSIAQNKVYAADAAGFVTAKSENDNSIISGVQENSYARDRVKSYLQLARDRDTAALVAEKLGLDDSPEALIGRITVTQPPDTVLIQINARADSPRAAQQLADSWVIALGERVDGLENPKPGDAKDNQQAESPFGDEATVRVELSSAAALPTTPVSPKPLRNAIVGIFLGLMLGFGAALLRHRLDRRIRSTAQLDSLGVPVVGQLPQVQSGTGPLGIVAETGQQSSFHAAEGFRILRTNLAFIDVDNPPRSIVVTSPRQGDGKSSIAVNLAAAIAVGGRSVTLVDGDLRRPRVSNTMGVANDIGLTDVLAGRVDLQDAIQKHEHVPNLFALPSGSRPPNPSELVASQAMRNTIQKLSQDTMVIIDAPPLLPVTDAAVLSTAADGVIIVVSAGRTIDTQLAASLRAVRAVSGHVFGVVLNKIPVRGPSAYYYKQYYYEYSDGPKRSRRKRKSKRTGSATSVAPLVESQTTERSASSARSGSRSRRSGRQRGARRR